MSGILASVTWADLVAARHRVGARELCCEEGKRVHCVCRASVTCPVHGTICVGTHD